jgi:hypothetical protein
MAPVVKGVVEMGWWWLEVMRWCCGGGGGGEMLMLWYLDLALPVVYD